MTESLSVTRTRFAAGIWEGEVRGAGERRPPVEVIYAEQPVPDVSLSADESGRWRLRFVVPVEAVSEGVHTLLIRSAETGETLDSLTMLAGDPMDGDLRGEVALLRAELELLKRAFRRHVREG
ncbi:MAG: hypothetical protein ACLFTP_05520 [Rhodosalinus sp.]|uniref:hypothetical protein n=1 Tax=Rhodosalinus sp. TaxID=2047741 RepID=UPI00397AA94C